MQRDLKGRSFQVVPIWGPTKVSVGGEGEKEQEGKRRKELNKTKKSLGKYLKMRMVPILQQTEYQSITLLTSVELLPLALANAGISPVACTEL